MSWLRSAHARWVFPNRRGKGQNISIPGASLMCSDPIISWGIHQTSHTTLDRCRRLIGDFPQQPVCRESLQPFGTAGIMMPFVPPFLGISRAGLGLEKTEENDKKEKRKKEMNKSINQCDGRIDAQPHSFYLAFDSPVFAHHR